MGLPGMVLSAYAFGAGAIMCWAVSYQEIALRLSAEGIVLMVGGAIGFVVSSIVFVASLRRVDASPHSMERNVSGPQNRSDPVRQGIR
ncbi:MAG: hypothetical protein WA359_05860 [Acidimicrobiales bacterium]